MKSTAYIMFKDHKVEAWFCGLLCVLTVTAPINGIKFQLGRNWFHGVPVGIDPTTTLLVLLSLSLGAIVIEGRHPFAQEFKQTTRQIVDKLDGKWMLLWFAWMLMGILWSAEREIVLAGWLYSFAALLVALVVAHLVRKSWQSYLSISLMLSALLQSAVAIGQYLKQGTLGLTWLNERSEFLIFGEPRSHGLMGHPNPLAFFLLITLFALLAYIVASRRWLIAVAIAPILLAFLYTGSRGNFVSLLVGLTLCGLYLLSYIPWQRRLALMGTALVIMLIGIQLLPDSITDRLQQLSADHIDARLTWAYPYTLAIIREEPLFGTGIDTMVLEVYKRTNNQFIQLAHNIILITWAEQGIIGVVLFVLLCFSFLNRLHPRNTLPEFILTAGFLAMLVAMLVDIYFTFPYIRMISFWYWGYLWGQFLLREPA